jgi:hypothetical protein
LETPVTTSRYWGFSRSHSTPSPEFDNLTRSPAPSQWHLLRIYEKIGICSEFMNITFFPLISLPGEKTEKFPNIEKSKFNTS